MNLKDLGFMQINHDRFQKTNTPYKIYAELLDETSQEQFYDVLRQPYVTYGALMPDAHAGYSMPIGGVCSTKDVVVPQFVGFDIGCGMCAYKTDYTKEQIEKNANIIYNQIREQIPLGFSTHQNNQEFKSDLPLSDFAKESLESVGLKQLGTLGGGNHFIEIDYDSNNIAWIVIHSGSRGFGHKIASHYMLKAYLEQNPIESRVDELVAEYEKKNANFKKHNPEGFKKAMENFRLKQIEQISKKTRVDNIQGIWGLDTQSKLGQEYIQDQNFALNFALENRKRMIAKVHEIMNSVIGGNFEFISQDEQRFINKNHNHVEYDPNRKEWIHRKGATHADRGVMGVIPANMRDGTFIVRGKGCSDSLNSSSHGAGRVMSRKRVRDTISIEAFEESMRGIVGTVDKNTLDESPFAYKDIFEVMELQSELVDVVEHLKVIINIKDNTEGAY